MRLHDDEIQRLIGTYGEALGSCSRAPMTAGRRSGRYWILSVAGTAIVGIACLTVWPREAEAGTLKRINQALSNVRSMVCTTYLDLPAGRRPIIRTYYSDGMWRLDSRLGTKIEVHDVIRDGTLQYSYADEDFVVQSEAGHSIATFLKETHSALEYAKNGVRMGDTSHPTVESVNQHQPYKGRAAYVVELRRSSDHFYSTILVDKETDLPIESDAVVDDQRPGFTGSSQKIHNEYSFGNTIPYQTFEQDPGKRVIVASKAAREVSQLWRHPIASVKETELLNVSMTRDGTVWLAISRPNRSTRCAYPSWIDSSSNLKYCRLAEIYPAAPVADCLRQMTAQREVSIVGFTPLRGSSPTNRLITVNFAFDGPESPHATLIPPNSPSEKATGSHAGNGLMTAKPLEPIPGMSIRLAPKVEMGDVPKFFDALAISPHQAQVPQLIWSVRAKTLEADGAYEEAAMAYLEWAKARYNWVKYSAFGPIRDAARCYRKLGRLEDAARLEKSADDLKATQER